MQTISAQIPDFFKTIKLPSVMRWAMDKVKFTESEPIFCEGREVEILTWSFVGKMPRNNKRFFIQVDAPAEGRQYVASLNVRGGEYRGTRQTAYVTFMVYVAKDGEPLPTK